MKIKANARERSLFFFFRRIVCERSRVLFVSMEIGRDYRGQSRAVISSSSFFIAFLPQFERFNFITTDARRKTNFSRSVELFALTMISFFLTSRAPRGLSRIHCVYLANIRRVWTHRIYGSNFAALSCDVMLPRHILLQDLTPHRRGMGVSREVHVERS